MKLFFASISAVFLIFIASSFTTNSEPSLASLIREKAPNYSGEDLYKGLFQFRGEFAGKVKVSREMREALKKDISREDQQEINEFYDGVIASMKKVDPEFFYKFEKELKSKDLNRIERAFEDAAETSISALILSKHLKTTLTEKDQQILQELSTKHDLTDAKGLVSFVEDANEQTNLNIDLKAIKGFSVDNIGEPLSALTLYAGIVAVVGAAVMLAVLAANTVGVYAGVVAVQVMYIFTSATSSSQLDREKLVADLVEQL